MASARQLHDQIKRQADELRRLEGERQGLSNRVRESLGSDGTSKTLAQPVRGAPPRRNPNQLPPTPSKNANWLIAGLTVLFASGALLAVLSAAMSPAGAYLMLQDAICTVRGATHTLPEYTELAADFAALDAQPLPTVHTIDHNRSLFWGTYRPQVLAGVKSRETKSLLFGIGWYDLEGWHGVRHTAEERNDLLFRWDVHDGRHFGKQLIVDQANNLELVVRFLKSPSGDAWTMRIDGTRRGSSKPIEFFVYFATEVTAPAHDQNKPLLAIESDAREFATIPNQKLMSGAFTVGATLRVSGPLQSGQRRFDAHVTDAAGTTFMENHWDVFTWPSKAEQWNMDFRQGGQRLREHEQFRRHSRQYGSIVMKKKLSTDFRFDIKLTEQASTEPADRFPSLCAVSQAFADREQRFHDRFESTFHVAAKAAALASSSPGMPSVAALVKMSESAVSNMIGGIGYWHGDYKVKSAQGDKTVGPATLFSGVPSRAKFPRGFLWDEGFHQLLVAKWDAPLSKDIILHWIDGDVVDRETGWIPREQILGAEPRTRVPGEFVAQTRSHTNPPAMILQVENFALAESEPHRDSEDPFLRRALPAVTRWLQYLLKSQCGGSSDCSTTPLNTTNASVLFRWRSRNKYHLLASGLDDYPRPHCSPTWRELHVDLFSWAAMMSKTIDRIRTSLHGSVHADEDSTAAAADAASCGGVASGAAESCDSSAAKAKAVDRWQSALDEVHYDAARRRYSDVTGCTTDKLNSKYFSNFFGYVNLFPVLTMIVDDAQRARDVIQQARKELSGGYGLQSVGNSSRRQLTQHDDYWTGPIWININYLMLRALNLKYIPMLGEEAQDFYTALRADLVRNIGKEFVRTGKLWENYDLGNGKGRGTAPFTGWTALVVAILAEQY